VIFAHDDNLLSDRDTQRGSNLIFQRQASGGHFYAASPATAARTFADKVADAVRR